MGGRTGGKRRGFSIGSLSLEAVLVVDRGNYSITKDPMISMYVLTLGRDNGHSLHIPPIESGGSGIIKECYNVTSRVYHMM